MSFCDLRFRCAAVLLLVCVSVFSDEASIADKLRTIRITRMEFIEAPPEVCLEYIRRGVLRTGQVERLNFIYCFHQDDLNPTTVSLEVRNQSVKTALDGICTKANLRMVLAGHTIAFYPRNYQKRKIFTLSDDPNSQILYKEMNKKIVDVRYSREDSGLAFMDIVQNFLKQTDTNIEVPLVYGNFFVTLCAKGLSVKQLLEFFGECGGWTFKIDGFKIIPSQSSSPLQSPWSSIADDLFLSEDPSPQVDYTIPLRRQGTQARAGAIIIHDLNLTLVPIGPGEFIMGSPTTEKGRSRFEYQHKVTLTKPYWLGETEVTQAQYAAIMGTNPSYFNGVNRPVENVSWNAAVEFCQKLTERERAAGRLPDGQVYRLPTEAEWEYAARAGTTTEFHYGDSLSSQQANFNGNYPFGNATKGPYLDRTTDVASYKPNAWGLYDMHGNVEEWCRDDGFRVYPYGAITDPTYLAPSDHPSINAYRIIRGGSWNYHPEYCRSASNSRELLTFSSFNLGFRIARGRPSEENIFPSSKPDLLRQRARGKAGMINIPDLRLTLVPIKPGEFLMGSPTPEVGRGDDEHQHKVTMTKPYWLGETEVTQAQYAAIMGTNPSYYKGANRPVGSVSWDGAIEFCRRLTERERAAGRLPDGQIYRLPTEAEWEYAARAGTITVFHYGDSLSSWEANFCGHYPYGGAAIRNYHNRTIDVGSYKPNAWGLYDMHGNVQEMCSDWYGEYPKGPVADPTGPERGTYRVLRGGGCGNKASDCRSASRYHGRSLPFIDAVSDAVGFRIARGAPLP